MTQEVLYIKPTFWAECLRYAVLLAPILLSAWQVRRRGRITFSSLALPLIFTAFLYAVDPLRETRYLANLDTTTGRVMVHTFFDAQAVQRGEQPPFKVFIEGQAISPIPIEHPLRNDNPPDVPQRTYAHSGSILFLHPEEPGIRNGGRVFLVFPQGFHISWLLQYCVFFLPLWAGAWYFARCRRGRGRDRWSLGGAGVRAAIIAVWVLSALLLAMNVLVDYGGLPPYPAHHKNAASGWQGRLTDYSLLQRQADEPDVAYFTRVAETLHRHVLHLYEHNPELRVSFADNWLEWLAAVWDGQNYLNFQEYRFLLRRGFGLCSDFAVAVCDLLRENHFACLPVGVQDGHVVSQVFTLDGREMILDADMGLLLPHALAEIKMNLDLVRQFYSVFGAQAVEQHRAFYAQPIVGVYQPRSFADSPQSRLLRWALPLAVFCLGLGGLIICLSNVCVRAVCLAWCIFGALFLRNRQITDLAGALCLAGAAALFIPQEKISPLLDIRPEDGHCWVAPRPRLSPLLALAYEQPGDSLKNPQASRAAVLEAGKALALPHAAHDDIRRLGGGRYSHWREAVYFSSRDNSDPTVNGRSYTLLSPLQPRVWIYFLTAFSLLVLIGHITLRLRQQKRSRPLPVLHSLHYKIITIKDDAPQEDTNNSCVTLSAGDLAWLDRFPALKAAVRLKSGDRQVENALLQNGKIQLPNTTETIHDISMELPYYTCDSLYKDHVVLPLDVYVKKIVPTWINEKAPSYFYSALVLFGEAGMFVFDHNFNGYADFIQYIARNIDSQSNMPAMRWGLKVLASKLPNPIAASREICFHLGHDDISLPLSITISPTNACNLRCTICGSQDHIDRNKIPRAFIKREVFEKLAETMFPFCHVVELNSLGEPTLHKDFGYFIELINNYDCKLWLLTNGTNLTEEILGALEQARGNLSLSIDATGTIFEQQRVNASWKQVEANVRKLMAVRDKSKLAVTLYPTLTRKTAADAVPLCIWADEMGLDAVDFHYYDPIYDGIEQCPTDEEKAALEKSLLAYIRRYEPAASISLQLRQLHPQTRTLRNYAERAVGKIITSANKWQSSSNISQTPSLTQKFPFGRRYYYTNLPKTSLKQNEAHPWYVCVAPLSNAEFNLAGDFSVCCRTQKTLFGSGLTDESFFAAWFGEPIQAVRRSFLRENPTADCMPECKGCIAQYGHID